LDNIYVTNKINNMSKSIIKSIKQTDYTTIITTKSNIVKVYTFKTIKQNNEYYNSITNNLQYYKVNTNTIR
jgi:hypothetical protein